MTLFEVVVLTLDEGTPDGSYYEFPLLVMAESLRDAASRVVTDDLLGEDLSQYLVQVRCWAKSSETLSIVASDTIPS
jgi:hypothetical protein